MSRQRLSLLLQGLLGRELNRFLDDILLVADGIRMGFLVDYANPPKHELSREFKKIQQESFCVDVCLIYLDQFLFFINKSLFLQKRSLLLDSGNINLTFIDVNKTNLVPQICSESTVSFITTKILSITKHIETEIEKSNIVDLPLNLGIFLISVTGWLLEYPVIYYHSAANDESNTNWANCLSRIPLKLYSLIIHNKAPNKEHVVLSFSVPYALLGDIPNVNMELHETFKDRIKKQQRWSNYRLQEEVVSKPQFTF